MDSRIYVKNSGKSHVWVLIYCFFYKIFKSRGKGAQGESVNNQVHEGEK